MLNDVTNEGKVEKSEAGRPLCEAYVEVTLGQYSRIKWEWVYEGVGGCGAWWLQG